MRPEEIIDLHDKTSDYIIDIHAETPEGEFAFHAVTTTPEGETAIWPFQIVAAAPLNPNYQIVGYIFEGTQEAAKEWFEKNEKYLSKLKFKTQ